jgi:Predicted transcriptional regulators
MFNTKKFGAYILQLRKNAEMTQSELADILNLTRQAVSKYETGESFPDVSIVIKIADFFKISLDELINSGNPTKGESKIIKSIISDNDEDKINASDIVNLAPLVKPSILGEVSKKLNTDGIDISSIVTLVQYLNDIDILELINTLESGGLNQELLANLVAVLDTPSKEAILSKIIEGEYDWHFLKAIYPYLNGEMHQVVEAAFVEGAFPDEVDW